MPDTGITRRKFIGLLGAAGMPRSARRRGARAGTAKQKAAPGYQALTAEQVSTLTAFAEQMIPADADAGAREAGVGHYIDHILAGAQRSKLPRYAAGLAALDQTARSLHGRKFAQCTFQQQTALCQALEQGRAPGAAWRKISGQRFFTLAWRHVLEGYYGAPANGGNAGYASWHMTGFLPPRRRRAVKR